MIRKFWMLMVMLLLSVGVLQAQDGGRGVIRIPITSAPEDLLNQQPLQCFTSFCTTLNAMLFPTLQAEVDGRFVPADAGNNGLAESVEFVDDQTAIFTLRDDLTWQNGLPITAYDVFYSYLMRLPRHMLGAVPLDEQRIAFLYEAVDCAMLDRTQFPVIAARTPALTEHIINFFADAEGDLLEQSVAWFEQDNYSPPTATYTALLNNGLTAGDYVFHEVRALESLRLTSVDSEQAVVFEVLPANRDRVSAFVEGHYTLVDAVPYDERGNLINTDTIDTHLYPANYGYYLRFNFTAPYDPQPAFNRFGEEVEQTPHPIMTDPAIRQAIRVGLDVDAIINRALNGYGIPLNGTQAPDAWARNTELEAPVYDPVQARRILEDAGWRDSNRDNLRECITCTTARENLPLSVTLYVGNDVVSTVAGEEIARQLGFLGMSVSIASLGSQLTIPSQDFDMYLAVGEWLSAGVTDRGSRFQRAEDTLFSGDNDSSYVNEELESLFNQAANVPDCDADERAELYAQTEAIIAQDLPEIWLFSPLEMIALQDEVLNVSPIDPLWNINAWVVIDQEVGG